MSRSWRGAIDYCAQPPHLCRTLRIALVVGLVLTAINQLDVIASGDATRVTWIKCAMNFIVPFIVSNLGLLSGRLK
ncbi:MAG: nitrate/nitrite transporter NrtS [Acidimicrobiales bacterium]